MANARGSVGAGGVAGGRNSARKHLPSIITPMKSIPDAPSHKHKDGRNFKDIA
jgi:hypothetical protein